MTIINRVLQHMKLNEFRKGCSDLARRTAGIADLLHVDDPHDAFAAMKDAFCRGEQPAQFVRVFFWEEIQNFVEIEDAREALGLAQEERWYDDYVDSIHQTLWYPRDDYDDIDDYVAARAYEYSYPEIGD